MTPRPLSQDNETILHLEDICRIFTVGDEKVKALQQIQLEVKRGEYTSIMGPSGSGKSTLLNILGLLDRPDSGVYRLNDVDTTDLSDDRQAEVRRHEIGFIFQFFHLIPRLTAFENVELPMVLAGIDPAQRRKRVAEVLERLGLSGRARHRPDQLSGGQRQRVAIARATIMKPEIILADEPTGNLDRSSGQEVIQTIEALNREGMTVIMVTHDPELGQRTRRRIQMLDGRIVLDSRED
jgi:putative ABC transport system ATP-binding protein